MKTKGHIFPETLLYFSIMAFPIGPFVILIGALIFSFVVLLKTFLEILIECFW